MDADLYKITPEDFTGKGVSAQSNPMELPEDEAKAVFDQLAKDVITPKFNQFVDALADLDITPDADKPISEAVQQALDGKIDRERRTGSETEEKVLSDNNYSDEEKEKVRENAEARHTHENKALLDEIRQEDIENWNGGNVLTKDNETPYTPEGPYQPVTVEYLRAHTLPRDNDDVYVPTGNYHPVTVQYLREKTLPRDNEAEYFPEGDFHPATVRFVRDNTLPRDNTEEYYPTLPFHPATVDYVDKKVLNTGAADMTKAIYDPNSRATDIFAYTDRKADDAKYMTDDVTGKRYFLGVSDGGLYYEEATE